jgi:hypothetical protein
MPVTRDREGLRRRHRGCQIFLGATHQIGKNIPYDQHIYHMTNIFTIWPTYLPYDQHIYQMAEKCTKWRKNTPIFSIARPSKIYPNWYFCFENIPSGNPWRHVFKKEVDRVVSTPSIPDPPKKKKSVCRKVSIFLQIYLIFFFPKISVGKVSSDHYSQSVVNNKQTKRRKIEVDWKK